MRKSNPLRSLRAKPALLLIAVVLSLACMAPHVMGDAPGVAAPGEQRLYDVVVFGDSSGAVIAAIAAKREGRLVVLISPTGFPGGMSSSGLGALVLGAVSKTARIHCFKTP